MIPGTFLGVSKNRGTTKSSILIGFSSINHPFWGSPIFGNTLFVCFGSTSWTDLPWLIGFMDVPQMGIYCQVVTLHHLCANWEWHRSGKKHQVGLDWSK